MMVYTLFWQLHVDSNNELFNSECTCQLTIRLCLLDPFTQLSIILQAENKGGLKSDNWVFYHVLESTGLESRDYIDTFSRFHDTMVIKFSLITD